MRYHVNVQTQFDRDIYVEANSPEKAEEKVREMGEHDPDFWDREHWIIAEDSEETYFVEESP